MKHLQEPLGDLGLGLGKVVLLTKIFFQVEELHASVFVIFDQFVLPGTNGAIWTLVTMIAVVGEVPVDRPPFVVLSFQSRDEATTVFMLIR